MSDQEITTTTIEFTIPGVPIGKPRMTQRDKWQQRPAVVKYRTWADSARLALKQRGGLPEGADPIGIHCNAVFPLPASWSKKKRLELAGEYHQSKPDADNIAKAVMDALFKEDSGIAFETVVKRWQSMDDTLGPRLDVIVTCRIAEHS